MKFQIPGCLFFRFLLMVILGCNLAWPVKAQQLLIEKIQFLGNHKTKSEILFRELEFKTGDSILADELDKKMQQSRNHLLNLSLFNFVTYDTNHSGNNHIVLTFHVTERWYLWPIPVLEIPGQNLNTWLVSGDFSKINYGIWITQENFRGRNEILKLMLGTGFDNQIGFSYQKPFANKMLTYGWSIEGSYIANHQIIIDLINNKRLYLKNPTSYLHHSWNVGLSVQLRPKIHNSHLLKISYQEDQFSDTIFSLHPDYAGGHLSPIRFCSVYYKFKHDVRDDKSYPLRGHYVDFSWEQNGFDFIGSTVDAGNFRTSVRKYSSLGSGFYWDVSLNGMLNSGTPRSFFLRNMLGSESDEISGYNYYMIPYDTYYSIRNDLKFCLIAPNEFSTKLLPWEKFSRVHYALYLRSFAYAAKSNFRSPDLKNPLNNAALYSAGLGFDFVTYYDKVFRFELSLNAKNETGYFFYLKAPL